MKPFKTIGVIAFSAALAALVSIPSASGRERLFRDVSNIWVDSNMCTTELESQLSNRGFGVTTRERAADAFLEVDLRPVPDHVGHSYRYTATLRDADGRVLMSKSDQETSLIMSKVCPSISNDVVDDIEARTG